MSDSACMCVLVCINDQWTNMIALFFFSFGLSEKSGNFHDKITPSERVGGSWTAREFVAVHTMSGGWSDGLLWIAQTSAATQAKRALQGSGLTQVVTISVKPRSPALSHSCSCQRPSAHLGMVSAHQHTLAWSVPPTLVQTPSFRFIQGTWRWSSWSIWFHFADLVPLFENILSSVACYLSNFMSFRRSLRRGEKSGIFLI